MSGGIPRARRSTTRLQAWTRQNAEYQATRNRNVTAAQSAALRAAARRDAIRGGTVRSFSLTAALMQLMADGESCPVSLDPLGMTGERGNIPVDIIQLKPCGHYLNADSFEAWLPTSFKCPMCRSEVVSAKRYAPVVDLGDD